MSDQTTEVKKVNAVFENDLRNQGPDRAYMNMRARNAERRKSKERDKKNAVEGIRSNLTLGGKRALTDSDYHIFGDFRGIGEGHLKEIREQTGKAKNSFVWSEAQGKFILRG